MTRAGDDVHRVRLDLDGADRRDGAVARAARHVQDEARRVDERVVARVHRRRARVVGAPLEDDLAARLAGDRRDDPERLAARSSTGPCSMCSSTNASGSSVERLAPQRPGLLGAERDDRQRRVGQPLGRLDPGEDAEHAVEAAAVRNRVEMRARPDARVAAPAEQVAGLVDLDLEPGLAHPAGGERVRRVLGRRVAGPVADRIDLLDPLVDSRQGIGARKRGCPRFDHGRSSGQRGAP